MAKRDPPLSTTFALLSCGYVMSSYQEVKSIVLHTLNRARFTVAAESFLKTEFLLCKKGIQCKVFSFSHGKKHRPIVLGPRFSDAFQDPNPYLAVEPIFENEPFIVTYSSSKGNVYALFKNQAKSDDILKAAYHPHVLLHIIRTSNQNHSSFRRRQNDLAASVPTLVDLQSHMAESYKMVSALYGPFKNKVKEQGWIMSESLLNPGL